MSDFVGAFVAIAPIVAASIYVRFSRYKVSDAALNILTSMEIGETLFYTDISKRLGKGPGYIYPALDRLERQGLLYRFPAIRDMPAVSVRAAYKRLR